MDKCLKAIEWEKWKLVDDKWDEGNISSHLTLPPKWFQIYIPDAPCMEYVWVFTKKTNVGKYSIHGAFGYVKKV